MMLEWFGHSTQQNHCHRSAMVEARHIRFENAETKHQRKTRSTSLVVNLILPAVIGNVYSGVVVVSTWSRKQPYRESVAKYSPPHSHSFVQRF